MYLLIIMFLTAPLVAGCFAGLLSRLWRQRGRRPGWIAGILAILAAAPVAWMVSWFCVFHTQALYPWSASLTGFAQVLVSMIAWLAVPGGILPAALIVEFHQRAYDRDIAQQGRPKES
jgi:Na+/proline symporter